MSLAAFYLPLTRPVSSTDVFAQLSAESQEFLLALMQEFLSIEQSRASLLPRLPEASTEASRLPRRATRMASCQLSLVYSRAHQQSG